MSDLIKVTANGLYCPQGDFYLDPLRPVNKAIISHAHTDHARFGMQQYLTHPISAQIMKVRLADNIQVSCLDYSEKLNINGVTVSLHPAGHIPGSAQIRLEYKDEVLVYTGDFNTQKDKTVTDFELVKCHTLITECTFGLPVFRWRQPKQIYTQIREWIADCKSKNIKPVLLAYALGKAQRLIAELSEYTFAVHGAVQQVNNVLKNQLNLTNTFYVNAETRKNSFDLIVAPPSVYHANWLNKFGTTSCAFASGWMAIRGNRRRQSYDRGFVLSDHADFNSLFDVVKATQAQQVYTTHGYCAAFARHLSENAIQASELEAYSKIMQEKQEDHQVEVMPE